MEAFPGGQMGHMGVESGAVTDSGTLILSIIQKAMLKILAKCYAKNDNIFNGNFNLLQRQGKNLLILYPAAAVQLTSRVQDNVT